MKITIELDERQYKIVMSALDLFSRVGTGQLSVLDDLFRDHFWTRKRELDGDFDFVRSAFNSVKWRLWKFTAGASHSIRTAAVPSDFREAYDIIQVLRKAVHDATNGPPESINAREPWLTSDRPPVSVKVEP